MGKVPALVDGDVKLWDSGAICLYLADAYPEAGLGVPIGDPARGAFLQWTLYTNAVMEPAMGERFGRRPVNTLQNGFGSFDLMIDTLVASLASGPWILGARFTAPDVLLGSGIHFMDVFKILPDRPELRAYAERCRARPAFQRAAALESA
jgi:glutathione S-transferase